MNEKWEKKHPEISPILSAVTLVFIMFKLNGVVLLKTEQQIRLHLRN